MTKKEVLSFVSHADVHEYEGDHTDGCLSCVKWNRRRGDDPAEAGDGGCFTLYQAHDRAGRLIGCLALKL